MTSSTRHRALALGIVASLALGGCGSSEKASDAVTPENVELPAEQAMSGVDASPVADPSAAASAAPTTTEGVAADAGRAAADVVAAANAAGADGPPAKKPIQ